MPAPAVMAERCLEPGPHSAEHNALGSRRAGPQASVRRAFRGGGRRPIFRLGPTVVVGRPGPEGSGDGRGRGPRVPARGGTQAAFLGVGGRRGGAVSMSRRRPGLLLPRLGAAVAAVSPTRAGSGASGAPAPRSARPLGGDAGHGRLTVGGQVPRLAGGVRDSLPGTRSLAVCCHGGGKWWRRTR